MSIKSENNCPHIPEVTGSNPVSPTRLRCIKKPSKKRAFLLVVFPILIESLELCINCILFLLILWKIFPLFIMYKCESDGE